MYKFRLLLLLMLCSLGLEAQYQYSFMFRIHLSDKGTTSFQTDKPEEFLSQRSIERRVKYNIAIDETDLPVSDDYISQIVANGCEVVAKSKWLNTVSVLCQDTTIMASVRQLPFVNNVIMVGRISPETTMSFDNKYKNRIRQETEPIGYGRGQVQATMIGVDYLHGQGYRGEGMQIAVIDAGYYGLSELSRVENKYFKTINILGHKDFVYDGLDLFGKYDEHGTAVLSTMATNYIDSTDTNSSFVGTAPNAGYWLLRSENIDSEYPIEEDYWIAAAEYADSVGVDMVHSSLGYYDFEYPSINSSYKYEQMDGKTAFITLGAEQLVAKGVFLVNSMGNEGDKDWKYMAAPADGEGVFSVGAVKKDSTITTFSSRGPTADGRIKPDAVALGSSAVIAKSGGYLSSSSGTSFSAPIMSGAIACLWQAYPQLTNRQIADAIRQSGDRYLNPDGDFGYGIPNMWRAVEIIQNLLSINSETVLPEMQVKIIADSSTGNLYIKKEADDAQPCNVSVYTIDGKSVLVNSFTSKEKAFELGCNRSLYLVRIHYNNQIKTQKIYL